MRLNFVQEAVGGLLGKALKRGFSVGGVVLVLAAVSSNAHASATVAHDIAPKISTEEADRPEGPNVFNTVALPIRARPTSTRWAKLMSASLDQPTLAHLVAAARDLPRQEQVAYVHRAVGRAIYASRTAYNCSDDGYWAAASETLARGRGDCIDIAVAKMEALRLLGIPKKDLYLITGYVRGASTYGKGRESAALLVRLDGHFWILPERFGYVVEAGRATDGVWDFNPILTYGVGMTWVHGRLMKTAMLAK